MGALSDGDGNIQAWSALQVPSTARSPPAMLCPQPDDVPGCARRRHLGYGVAQMETSLPCGSPLFASDVLLRHFDSCSVRRGGRALSNQSQCLPQLPDEDKATRLPGTQPGTRRRRSVTAVLDSRKCDPWLPSKLQGLARSCPAWSRRGQVLNGPCFTLRHRIICSSKSPAAASCLGRSGASPRWNRQVRARPGGCRCQRPRMHDDASASDYEVEARSRGGSLWRVRLLARIAHSSRQSKLCRPPLHTCMESSLAPRSQVVF